MMSKLSTTLQVLEKADVFSKTATNQVFLNTKPMLSSVEEWCECPSWGLNKSLLGPYTNSRVLTVRKECKTGMFSIIHYCTKLGLSNILNKKVKLAIKFFVIFHHFFAFQYANLMQML